MSPRRQIVNLRTGQVILARARVCAGFGSRLIGLSFQGQDAIHEGALFICSSPGRLAAAIHTLGVRSQIGVVWLSRDRKVVDKKLAKSWRFAHVPSAPAMYYLEAEPAILDLVEIGDQLRMTEAAS